MFFAGRLCASRGKSHARRRVQGAERASNGRVDKNDPDQQRLVRLGQRGTSWTAPRISHFVFLSRTIWTANTSTQPATFPSLKGK